MKSVMLMLGVVVCLTSCQGCSLAKVRIDKFDDGKVTLCGNKFASDEKFLEEAKNACGGQAKPVGISSIDSFLSDRGTGHTKIVRKHCRIFKCGE